jgi:hypothetical protein
MELMWKFVVLHTLFDTIIDFLDILNSPVFLI